MWLLLDKHWEDFPEGYRFLDPSFSWKSAGKLLPGFHKGLSLLLKKEIIKSKRAEAIEAALNGSIASANHFGEQLESEGFYF